MVLGVCPRMSTGWTDDNNLSGQVYHFSAKEAESSGSAFKAREVRSAQWRVFENRAINDYSFAPSQDTMLTIEPVDLSSKQHIRRFVDLPYRLYKNHPQWVPPLRMDVELMLNKQKHPFYEHSDADFFVAAARWARGGPHRRAGKSPVQSLSPHAAGAVLSV